MATPAFVNSFIVGFVDSALRQRQALVILLSRPQIRYLRSSVGVDFIDFVPSATLATATAAAAVLLSSSSSCGATVAMLPRSVRQSMRLSLALNKFRFVASATYRLRVARLHRI